MKGIGRQFDRSREHGIAEFEHVKLCGAAAARPGHQPDAGQAHDAPKRNVDIAFAQIGAVQQRKVSRHFFFLIGQGPNEA